MAWFSTSTAATRASTSVMGGPATTELRARPRCSPVSRRWRPRGLASPRSATRRRTPSRRCTRATARCWVLSRAMVARLPAHAGGSGARCARASLRRTTKGARPRRPVRRRAQPRPDLTTKSVRVTCRRRAPAHRLPGTPAASAGIPDPSPARVCHLPWMSKTPGRRPAPTERVTDTGRQNKSGRCVMAAVSRERVRTALEPVVTAAGFDLEDVAVTAAGRRSVIRVIVDRDGGVDMDAIAAVSRVVSDALDNSDATGDTPYTLEVTSPGVDRPLTEPRHWRRAAGRLVVAGDIRGRVVGADDAAVTLLVDGTERVVPYTELDAGKVQIEFDRAGGGA